MIQELDVLHAVIQSVRHALLLAVQNATLLMLLLIIFVYALMANMIQELRVKTAIP